jgi:hypothetical protein
VDLSCKRKAIKIKYINVICKYKVDTVLSGINKGSKGKTFPLVSVCPTEQRQCADTYNNYIISHIILSGDINN